MATQLILHETEVRGVIADQVAAGVSVAAPTASGATYLQATAQTSVTAINEIIAALVTAGILDAA